jgi:hypothetical protein
MTINLADNNPRVEYTVAEGVTQDSFAVPFEFFNDGDLSVYVDGVLKAEGTDYTITGGDGSTGDIEFVAATPPDVQQVTGITGGSKVTIIRTTPIERTSDFSAGADINRAALNEQFDILTAMVADAKDRIDRTIRANPYEVSPSLVLPTVASRKGKVLAFDATTGAVINGPTFDEVADAQQYAIDAAASADAASDSEDAAAASELAAASSESHAASSEAAAAASETAAAASELAAAASETNAAASEAAASASEIAAAASETAAAASESAAATSETNAAASASSASSSATAAAASADAALSALDSFDDRYLGQKASDPSVDNDGNPLLAGALYYNATDDVMKVYEGSAWVAAYASLSGALLSANNLSDLTDEVLALQNLGLTATATELNVLDGVTASTAELNILDGVTATTAELNQLDTNTFTADITIPDKIIHAGDTDTAIRFPAADTVTVETAGTERMRIDSSGKVGIGTSSLAATARLTTNGSILASSSAATYIEALSTTSANSSISLGRNNYAEGGASLTMEGNGNLWFRVTDNAGIASSITFDSNISGGLTANFIGLVNFSDGSAAAPAISNIGDTNTGMFFPAEDTIAFSEGGVERLRIASSGQIGIGGANYGTSGQVLTSGGSGAAPSWASLSVIDYQAFTASGTWTKPAGISADAIVYVEMIGGGGGGGARARGGGNTGRTTGGGGGGFTAKTILASTLGATVAVTVGAGGAGGVTPDDNVNTPGAAGGNSSFGSFSIPGGSGGVVSSSSTGPDGNANLHGFDGFMGGDALWSTTGATNKINSTHGGGAGGGSVVTVQTAGTSSFAGNGGNGLSATVAGMITATSGSAPGGGGGGATNASTTSSSRATGGSGGRGEVRVWTIG